MASFPNKFSLFLPKKKKEDTDFGDNWRALEVWGNQSGLTSFHGTASQLQGWTNLGNPLQAKILFQAAGALPTFNAGGQVTISYPIAFPNGTLIALADYTGATAAGAAVTSHVIAATAAGITIELRSIIGGVVAPLAGAQGIQYLAVGW